MQDLQRKAKHAGARDPQGACHEPPLVTVAHLTGISFSLPGPFLPGWLVTSRCASGSASLSPRVYRAIDDYSSTLDRRSSLAGRRGRARASPSGRPRTSGPARALVLGDYWLVAGWPAEQTGPPVAGTAVLRIALC